MDQLIASFRRYVGYADRAVLNFDDTYLTIKNSYFRRAEGENGIRTCIMEDRALHLLIENTTFVDASRKGEAVLRPHLANDRCTVTVRDCTFLDTRGNAAAIRYLGTAQGISIEGTSFEGYDVPVAELPAPPTEAPDFLENHSTDWESGTEDSHTVLAEQNADFTALDALYEGRLTEIVGDACDRCTKRAYELSK
jgi:hypothetical protein